MEKISEIGIWIAQIHQISDRVMEIKLKENHLEGFSAAQGRVLFILEQIPNEQLLKIPIQGLVKRLNLSSSTFTQLLDSLQDKCHSGCHHKEHLVLVLCRFFSYSRRICNFQQNLKVLHEFSCSDFSQITSN